MRTCAELVDGFTAAGLEALIPEWLTGEGYIPGTKEEIAAKPNPCEGAVPREHSHFFTADGRFGSRDSDGTTVDSGTYVLLDETHFRFGEGSGATVSFTIANDEIVFGPVVPENCSTDECRDMLAYAITVAYPGQTWHRQSVVPGRLAFRRYLDPSETRGALFTSATDGSGEQQITDPPASAVDDSPDWSPDGKRLLFTRYADLGTDHESHLLFTVSSDGSGLTPLSPDVAAHGDVVEGFDDTGVFSPDGTHIAFSYAHGQVAAGGTHGIPVGSDQLEFSDIVVMDADGGNRNQVTHDAAYSGDASGVAWSPDGTKLVYARFNSGAADPPKGLALFIIDVDGSNQRQLTPWAVGAGGTPDWSPATDLIVFRGVADEESGLGNFFTIHPDGTALTQITDFTSAVISHKVGFSPDGMWVVFAKTGTNRRNDVFIAKADGSSVRPVTNTAQADSSPDWSSQ